MDKMLDAARENGLELGLGDEATPLDVALKLLLLDPRVLEDANNWAQTEGLREYRYFTTDANPVPAFEKPTLDAVRKLEERLGAFYGALGRGRGTRVFAYEQQRLTQEVQAYLVSQRSPLAEYASTLVTLKNWKQIVALANAESTLCRNYPEALANCWGVGGSALWDMGDNLGQGVVKMNQFLNTNPKGPVKYAQMSFDRMNGLYKKPAAAHWAYNAETVYDDLAQIENSL
jgi:hypothetical protein